MFFHIHDKTDALLVGIFIALCAMGAIVVFGVAYDIIHGSIVVPCTN